MHRGTCRRGARGQLQRRPCKCGSAPRGPSPSPKRRMFATSRPKGTGTWTMIGASGASFRKEAVRGGLGPSDRNKPTSHTTGNHQLNCSRRSSNSGLCGPILGRLAHDPTVLVAGPGDPKTDRSERNPGASPGGAHGQCIQRRGITRGGWKCKLERANSSEQRLPCNGGLAMPTARFKLARFGALTTVMSKLISFGAED